MLKLKHLRHPLRTLGSAKAVFAAHLSMKVLGPRGEARFKGDARYDLRNVTEGFAPRLEKDGDDSAILERICTAYLRAIDQEPLARPVYQATGWWKEVRRTGLTRVRSALASRDIAAVQSMYRNFFRDSCSAGLIGVPYKMSEAYSGRVVDDSYRRFFLSNALHRIDHWKMQTGHRFALRDLAGPETGNPFGVSIDGTLVRAGTESHHYCAHRIAGLLPPGAATVMEIGGGFGSMAYYLLRDRAETTYINFDMPESIALASYYLLKTFPQRKFLLYGEEGFSAETWARHDVVLLPTFKLSNEPRKRAHLTVSSHTMSGLSRAAIAEYMSEIVRTTRRYFVLVGRSAENGPLRNLIRARYPSLRLVEARRLEWNRQRILHEDEEECVYEIAAA